MKNLIIVIFLILIVTYGCNENYWGYNYEAPPLVNVTRIQGNLSDKFSGDPIHPANVIVNGQETWADENGNFLLNYIIPDEVEPNQQEVGYMNIVAPDYLFYSTTFIIFPVENNLDIELEYAVPIVMDAVSHGDSTQAIIKDYQGIDDIRFVSVTFLEDTGAGIFIRKEFEMDKISRIDLNTAYYQFVVYDINHVINLSNISDWFRITARDKSDNVHRLDFTIEPDSSLLF